MDYLCCCFSPRKPSKRSSDRRASRQSIGLGSSEVAWGDGGTNVNSLSDLRQKCGDNTLSTAEARALINASGKYNDPLTPREIEELHRILSPSSQIEGTKKPSSPERIRSPRTPTNQMMPSSQEQSDLFCLPAELRSQIWRHAIGGHKIYLAVKEGKLVQQDDMQRPYWRHIDGLLYIPLICRKSYLESINLLYSENTLGFGFGSLGSSKDFFSQADRLLLPQCVDAITSLEVGFHLSGGHSQYYDSDRQAWDLSLEVAAPEPLSNWISVFRALTQMKQLTRLVVVVWVSGDRRQEFRAREPDLMNIPMCMTRLENFEVWLPWEEDVEGERDVDESEAATPRPDVKRKTPYIVRRDHEDRDIYGVNVPNWMG